MLRMRGFAGARAAGKPRTATTRTAAAFVAAVALITTGGLANVARAGLRIRALLGTPRAEQLQAEIEANGNRVSILDEQYNQAQDKIQKTTDQLNADRAQVEAKTRETDRVRALLADRAAELYMGAGNPAPLAAFDVSSTQQLGSRSAYGGRGRRSGREADGQRPRRHRRARPRAEVARQGAPRAESERNALDATRQEINDATAQQEALLAQANGKIKTLVDEIQAEKEREQEAAARASMERAARGPSKPKRTPRTQSSSTNGSSDNGSSTGSSDNSPSEPPPQDLPTPSSHAQVAVDTAEAQLGKPYVYAGSGPDSFDCSGLTMYAWAAAGVSLPHNADAQYQSLPHVPIDALEPGDLVFFGSPIHHVGMFVGNGTMIEAPYTGVNVRYHTIYRSDYAGAARP